VVRHQGCPAAVALRRVEEARQLALPVLPQEAHPARREQVPVAQHQGCPAAVALRRVEGARQPVLPD